MVTTRKVLTIFMASPSDVSAERSALAAVINRINRRSARELGWQLEVVGWEDTIPGYGRPQSRINPDLERCDVFVGILWKRWGSPTGTFSSGFHEEFEGAMQRRNSSTDPEILLYMRNVGDEATSDPGPQLRQVLEFRHRLTVTANILYKVYDQVDEFTELVDYHLSSILMARAAQSDESRSIVEPALSASTSQPRSTDRDAWTYTPLATLVGNPTMSPDVVLARWVAESNSPDVHISSCGVEDSELWTLDPLDPLYGLTLVLGSTGSGKSNAILSAVYAVLFSLPPPHLRLSTLEVDGWQNVRALWSIGATSLSVSGGSWAHEVLEEATRRELVLARAGAASMSELWRVDPEQRAECPVWLICADEASQVFNDVASVDTLTALAARVAGLGIHFILGSQRLGVLGDFALATRTRRIALHNVHKDDFVEFTGMAPPLGIDEREPGGALCIEGESVKRIRFARVGDEEVTALQRAFVSWATLD